MPANFSNLRFPCPHCADEISFETLLKDLDKAVLPRLSPTEKVVVTHSARGKTVKEIGALMRISYHTVKIHLGNAYKRLGVNNQLDLVFLMINALPKPVKDVKA